MRRRRLWGHGVPEAAVGPLQRLETAEQAIGWITASEDGASATCVGVAPACKELRSGPNKSEREPTSARSTNYGSGHLIPAFHGTGRTFSLLPSHPLDAASCSTDAPWSRASEAKFPGQRWFHRINNGFNFVLCEAEPGGRGRRASFTKTRTPPESPLWGLRFANSRARPKFLTGTGLSVLVGRHGAMNPTERVRCPGARLIQKNE